MTHLSDPSSPQRRSDIPTPSSEEARRRMKATRRHGTKAELLLRQELDALGLQYKVDVAPVVGLRARADMVFTDARVAVFVDGCFWHGCPIHATWPKQNAAWWQAKLEANRERDARTERALCEAGWTVCRFWEHEDPAEAARAVAAVLEGRATTSTEH